MKGMVQEMLQVTDFKTGQAMASVICGELVGIAQMAVKMGLALVDWYKRR
jgi:hypothetical protein